MKLYDAEFAPSPRRVRIFLAEKGIDVPVTRIDLRAGDQLGDAYLAINPRGAVPALELDDGEILCESAAICRYFEALQHDPPLFGTTPIEIGRIESWTRRIESDGYAGVAYVLRNSSPAFKDRGLVGNMGIIPQIPELATRGTIMWNAFLDALDAQLRDRAFVAGDRYSFADITALVTVDFARAARLRVGDQHVHVAQWHARMKERPSADA